MDSSKLDRLISGKIYVCAESVVHVLLMSQKGLVITMDANALFDRNNSHQQKYCDAVNQVIRLCSETFEDGIDDVQRHERLSKLRREQQNVERYRHELSQVTRASILNTEPFDGAKSVHPARRKARRDVGHRASFATVKPAMRNRPVDDFEG